MTRLSVNVNKIATLRNARGGNTPDLLHYTKLIEGFGAQGITVHPRPDERHITYDDVHALKEIVTTEFNIEGNPKEQKFIDLVNDVLPKQVTLVPDNNNQLTSDHGWDTINEKDFLTEIVTHFKEKGIRTSVFIDPKIELIEGAKKIGTERIELYTESYARGFPHNAAKAILPFCESAKIANELGIGINAGHDLNLKNLNYFKSNIANLLEVSIGHALVSDALLFGMEKTIEKYLYELCN